MMGHFALGFLCAEGVAGELNAQAGAAAPVPQLLFRQKRLARRETRFETISPLGGQRWSKRSVC